MNHDNRLTWVERGNHWSLEPVFADVEIQQSDYLSGFHVFINDKEISPVEGGLWVDLDIAKRIAVSTYLKFCEDHLNQVMLLEERGSIKRLSSMLHGVANNGQLNLSEELKKELCSSGLVLAMTIDSPTNPEFSKLVFFYGVIEASIHIPLGEVENIYIDKLGILPLIGGDLTANIQTVDEAVKIVNRVQRAARVQVKKTKGVEVCEPMNRGFTPFDATVNNGQATSRGAIFKL